MPPRKKAARARKNGHVLIVDAIPGRSNNSTPVPLPVAPAPRKRRPLCTSPPAAVARPGFLPGKLVLGFGSQTADEVSWRFMLEWCCTRRYIGFDDKFDCHFHLCICQRCFLLAYFLIVNLFFF